jgi:acyl-CoA reductase-like NAD-dependent aldehyde dehydrogenase
MAVRSGGGVPIGHTSEFYIGGSWVAPSSDATFEVIDPSTEQPYFSVAEAQAADMARAVEAARAAFDDGPWPTMPPAERAAYLTRIAEKLRERAEDVGQLWPRESGVIYEFAKHFGPVVGSMFDMYAAMAPSYPFEAEVPPTMGGSFGLLSREPVGVVGAIVPWNSALGQIGTKLAPALLAGCTVILKSSPEAPGEGYLIAEIAEEIGLPEGVLNVVTAGREVSELLVRDPRVDKISFTGSTAAGRRVGAICAERVARCTLELGGKSAAVVLDDIDLEVVASTIAAQECAISGQACISLTRIIVTGDRHDDFVDALAATFSKVAVGDPFETGVQMGPLATSVQRDRVEQHIAAGIRDGARLVTGGGRPAHLDKGWYVEPTVFADVDNSSPLGQEEIFGPVLSVIRARDEEHAVALANDTIYGLNASVFTDDADRARQVARRLRSGTVGHNASRSDIGVAFGGFKQSGIGREGGVEGLSSYVETKYTILEDRPAEFAG